MRESVGCPFISEKSRLLCDQLQNGRGQDPQHTIFQLRHFIPVEDFLTLLECAWDRNEARLFRDITPFLLPSPEHLFMWGHTEFEHLVEELSVEWTKCNKLSGRRPKPDIAVGLAASAFTAEERAKLENHTSPDRATAFTPLLYFPFVLCECETKTNVNRADRQNMHSARLAVTAIDQLDPGTVDGEILVYSISHDNRSVNLYGHLVHKGVFYRHHINSFVLNVEGGQEWKKIYNFFCEVYRLVYPVHLQRIQKALAAMEDPPKVSTASSMASEGSEGRESHEPDLSSEIRLLRDLIAELLREHRARTAELEKTDQDVETAC